MAILVEGISVIVKVSAIQEKVNGDWKSFVGLVPNKTLCSDNEIARVGFMAPDDVKQFVDKLEENGLTFQINNQAIDIAVVDQIHGPTVKCGWLEFGHINLDNAPNMRIAACRLIGSNEDQIFMPEDWQYENSLSASYGFVPDGQISKSLKFLRHENSVDVYLNEMTGKEVYIGRAGQS